MTINGVTHRFAVITPETTNDPADLIIYRRKGYGA